MSEPAATPSGYPTTTKVLHWATLLVLLAQLVVGYTLDLDARSDRAEERLEQRADAARTEAAEERLDARADRVHDQARDAEPGVLVDRLTSGEEPLLVLHVALGVTVLVLALVRLVRRRVVPLPPWAETLSETERRLAHRTEQALYLTLVVMPLSGLGVLLVSEDLLVLHIVSHVVFFVAIALHLGLVLKHQLLERDRLLSRML